MAASSLFLNSTHNSGYPIAEDQYEDEILYGQGSETTSVVSDIFKKTIVDIALLGTLTFAAAVYAPIPLGLLPLIYLGRDTLFLNLAFRVNHALFNHFFKDSIAQALLKIAPAVNNAIYWDSTAGVLIHEAGHSLMAKLVFKNAAAKVIWLVPFTGATFFNTQTLSNIGNIFGRNASLFLTGLGGPLAGVLVGTFSIAAGLSLRETHSEVAAFFGASGTIAILHHVKYALSALAYGPRLGGHDFALLWYFGVHPLTAAVAIVAIPIIFTLGYLAWEQKRNSINS